MEAQKVISVMIANPSETNDFDKIRTVTGGWGQCNIKPQTHAKNP